MATFNYLVKGKADPAAIYLRLRQGKGIDISQNTGYVINPKDWSVKTKLPKQGQPERANLTTTLRQLREAIIDAFNETPLTEINSEWLKLQIQAHKGEVIDTEAPSELITDRIEYIIRNASTRRIDNETVGLSPNRVKGYVTFLNTIKRYQAHTKKTYKFSDLNKTFTEGFIDWLRNIQGYSINYVGKNIDNLKTVANDAHEAEIPVNAYHTKIKGFKENRESRSIVTLSLDELEIIKDTDLENNESLENARKWILIGCELGQRAGDLLRLTPNNIRQELRGVYVDLTQEKTGKKVTIKIVEPTVLSILLHEFPYTLSIQKLNKNIKAVCEKAGINNLEKGKKYDITTKRKKIGKYPKYELITSHCFRRSFASNFYEKIPTPSIMEITGHSKESMFLDYINQEARKNESADNFARDREKMLEAKKPREEMTVIKNTANN